MRFKITIRVLMLSAAVIVVSSCNQSHRRQVESKASEVWSVGKANQWYMLQEWLRCCDFIPSTAINQLEMWQAETFDTTTIDRELRWADEIGLNCMRVYLHHLAWEIDNEGFKSRVGKYLDIAGRHGIKTTFSGLTAQPAREMSFS